MSCGILSTILVKFICTKYSTKQMNVSFANDEKLTLQAVASEHIPPSWEVIN
ncbi:hypothetical protein C0J52_10581 [Blattella germanica]|nr:hypothetical protein C0J52_10581 [Blattella germanica]